MNKLIVSAPTFDIDGEILIEPLPSSEFGEFKRRASRSATLDGGASTTDFGFSHADRTFSIVFKPTEQEEGNIKRLVQLYAQIYVTTREGLFSGIPEYSRRDSTSTLTIQITEKVAGN